MSRYIYLPRNKSLEPLARTLRKNMTEEERALWFYCLKESPFRFSRQKIIGNYIVDFYCAKARLAIELDGSQHYEAQGIEYDEKRKRYLESLGVMVLRFSNADVNENLEAVKESIYAAMIERVDAYQLEKLKSKG